MAFTLEYRRIHTSQELDGIPVAPSHFVPISRLFKLDFSSRIESSPSWCVSVLLCVERRVDTCMLYGRHEL